MLVETLLHLVVGTYTREWKQENIGFLTKFSSWETGFLLQFILKESLAEIGFQEVFFIVTVILDIVYE